MKILTKNWTASQQNAINAAGGTVLVSAAAGSGKTAVLVQRVIEKITSCNNPIDIDKLLIVTFTNAAAAEMKERIAEKLADLTLKEPGNIRLKRQKILIEQSNISTIHSFCNNLIRENFYKLSISPDFKIADDNEITLLRNEALENVINEFYAKDDRLFYNLVESFSSDKNDLTLEDAIYTLYDFLRSHPFPDTWLKSKKSMYLESEDISKTPWAKVLFEYAKSSIDHALSLTHRSLKLIKEDDDIFNSYNDAFMSDLNMLLSTQESIENKNWEKISFKLQNFNFEKLKAVRGKSDNEIKLRVNANRKIVKTIKEKLFKYFNISEKEALDDIKKLRPLVEKFFDVVWRFWEELDNLKSSKNLADFGDLEHLTLKLLVKQTENGFEKTDEAKAISNKFEEVLVDEYQDTNEVQDIIFRAISKNENNLFIVGDVKQSIYGFRQAMPGIFLKRKEQYIPYDNTQKAFPAKIILDKNFRSRKGVTDFVNFTFKQLMSPEIGDMYYSQEEELKPGADYPKSPSPSTEIHIIDTSNTSEETDSLEAQHIASIINEKIFSGETVFENGKLRPITYRDFCILIRSANKHASSYAKELNLCGVPAWSDTSGDFFGTREISTMLSLLKVIDNPIQDVPLLSVLISPIFGFSAEKLTDIRLEDKNIPLYLALKSFADKGDIQSKELISEINDYRKISITMSSDELIEYIYEKTGFPSMVLAMSEPSRRLANLRLLADYAKTYESYGYKGLSGFIKFIDKLELKKSDLTPASTISEASNVVRIMSIHRSKGLEFPICIIAGCSNKFNKQHNSVLLHHDLGPGLKIRDTKNMIQYSSLPRDAISIQLEREYLSEELRVLYVAMTRAKENLIMVTSIKNPQNTLTKLATNLTSNTLINPYNVRSAMSFSDLILSCALRHKDGIKLRSLANCFDDIILESESQLEIKVISPNEENDDKDSLNQDIKNLKYDEELIGKIEKRINYAYPLKFLHNIPTKVSASELYKEDNLDQMHSLGKAKIPSFMLGRDQNASQKGIALHLFLEFADYKEASLDLMGQIEKLTSKKFISKEQASSLNIESLKRFFQSNLMKRIINAESYKRELRFNVEYDENIIKSNEVKNIKNELIVLQGAIDCVFIEDGKAVIVDYKNNSFDDENEYIKKYSNQLNLYKYAASKSLNIEVKECIVYSFKKGKEIYI